MAVSLTALNRLSGDIESVLTKHYQIKDAVRISRCFGYRQCHSPYCIRCASRRAYKQRIHLLEAIPALLAMNDRYQFWLLTGAAADSPDVKTCARSAVSGMRKVLKHPRLKGRVIAYFSALEVAHKHGRIHPCVHVHALVVTKPMDRGKYRISRKDWVAIWEKACPQHRMRLPKPIRRRNEPKVKEHLSMDVKLVPRTALDLTRVIKYCTKWAGTKRVTRDNRRLLSPNPEAFLERMNALKGVPKFFGELHKE